MNRLRRRLIDPDRPGEGPRAAEYAIILVVFAHHRARGAALTAGQTTRILSTVSGYRLSAARRAQPGASDRHRSRAHCQSFGSSNSMRIAAPEPLTAE